jgi:hypothetical protein
MHLRTMHLRAMNQGPIVAAGIRAHSLLHQAPELERKPLRSYKP